LTDETFADFSVDFTATGDIQVLLRDSETGFQYPYAASQNPCLPLALLDGASVRVHFQRKGESVSANGNSEGCTYTFAPNARLSLGFRGPSSGSATVTNVKVTRLGSLE
jgi:hypothetical protein